MLPQVDLLPGGRRCRTHGSSLAQALGKNGRDGAAVGLYDLAAQIGAPTALRDIGMREQDLDAAVGLMLEKVPTDNPRPVGEEDVRRLLEAAFAGRRPAPAAAVT